MQSFKSVRRSSTSSEKRQIEKYIKFFAIKALQSVVQSRLGSRNKTNCNPSAKGVDWFNISIPDGKTNQILQAKMKDLLGKTAPVLSSPLCVDIVLKATEGSYTVLETWQITLKDSATEDTIKNHFSIYDRLSVLLKSVISSSRLLPSYHVSRKSESDFLLYGRVHTELYPLHHFELHNTINIGSVITLAGVLNVKVLYRNKIWLSGSMHPHTYCIENIDCLFPLTKKEREEMFFQSVDMFEKEIAHAASETSYYSSNIFSTVSSKPTSELESVEASETNKKKNQLLNQSLSSPSVGHINEHIRPIAAFVEPSETISSLPDLDLPILSDVPPFMSLFNKKDSNRERKSEDLKLENDLSKRKLQVSNNHNIVSDTTISRTPEAVGFEDDFVLVELRPAFTDDESVGTLYRQCQSPAVLDMFASLELEDMEGDSIDLNTQLEKYQNELKEFQEYFKILS